MRASTKRLYSFLFSAVFFIGSFAAYASLLAPEYRAVNALRGELATKTEFLEKEERIVEQVQQLFSQYQGVQALEQTISLALPKDEGTAQLVNQMLTIARNAGIVVESFSLGSGPLKVNTKPGAKSVAPKIAAVTIAIDATGAYEAFKVFLQAIETNIRVMDVGNVKVVPKGDGLGYQLQATAYYQLGSQ